MSGGLPADCATLPISSGRLLVSRSHALFCPVQHAHVEALTGVLDQGATLESLPPTLQEALERHGFFGEPDPPSVQLQLTNACNLTCDYCCTNSGEARGGEVTLEQCRRVVAEAREVLGHQVRVAMLGGEPLLVPWALELAREVLDLELELTLFTNGLPLTDDAVARQVADLVKRGAEVRVSLAGASAEQCDQVSGHPRFGSVLGGIQRVADHGGEVVLDLMLLPRHVEDVAANLHALKERLPAGTRISLGLMYLSGREAGEHIFSSRSELESSLDRIAFEAGEAITAPERAPLTHRREGCGCAMGRHLHLRSDGALFTCFKMEEKVGDLAGGRGFAEQAQEVQAAPHPAASLSICADCVLTTLCGGGCRSENLLYTGDPDEPVCGPWRVQVLCELLAEEQVTAPDWPIPHLLAEAATRGIEAPAEIPLNKTSRHLADTE